MEARLAPMDRLFVFDQPWTYSFTFICNLALRSFVRQIALDLVLMELPVEETQAMNKIYALKEAVDQQPCTFTNGYSDVCRVEIQARAYLHANQFHTYKISQPSDIEKFFRCWHHNELPHRVFCLG